LAGTTLHLRRERQRTFHSSISSPHRVRFCLAVVFQRCEREHGRLGFVASTSQPSQKSELGLSNRCLVSSPDEDTLHVPEPWVVVCGPDVRTACSGRRASAIEERQSQSVPIRRSGRLLPIAKAVG